MCLKPHWLWEKLFFYEVYFRCILLVQRPCTRSTHKEMAEKGRRKKNEAQFVFSGEIVRCFYFPHPFQVLAVRFVTGLRIEIDLSTLFSTEVNLPGIGGFKRRLNIFSIHTYTLHTSHRHRQFAFRNFQWKSIHVKNALDSIFLFSPWHSTAMSSTE